MIHDELIDDFRTYMFIGGMPEVVDTFLAYKDKISAFKAANKKIKEIMLETMLDWTYDFIHPTVGVEQGRRN